MSFIERYDVQLIMLVKSDFRIQVEMITKLETHFPVSSFMDEIDFVPILYPSRTTHGVMQPLMLTVHSAIILIKFSFCH